MQCLTPMTRCPKKISALKNKQKLKQSWLLSFWNKIETEERLKGMLILMGQHKTCSILFNPLCLDFNHLAMARWPAAQIAWKWPTHKINISVHDLNNWNINNNKNMNNLHIRLTFLYATWITKTKQKTPHKLTKWAPYLLSLSCFSSSVSPLGVRAAWKTMLRSLSMTSAWFRSCFRVLSELSTRYPSFVIRFFCWTEPK